MRLKNIKNGDSIPLIGDDWELIPDKPMEVWTDVTADCELFEDNGFHGLSHNGVSRYQSTEWSHDGYRLRKVRLYTANPGLGSINGVPCIGKEQWAFIVEKREP